jgi:hypothetical protein
LLLDNLGREISRANRIGFHARASAFVLVPEVHPAKGRFVVDVIGFQTSGCEDEVFEARTKEERPGGFVESNTR